MEAVCRADLLRVAFATFAPGARREVKHPAPDTLNVAPPAAQESPAPDYAAPDRSRRRIGVYFVVEGISSHSVCLMLSSIYYFTTERFHWGSAQNFLMAAVLGVVYVGGALSAHGVATRLGRRQTLVAVYLLMSAAGWVLALDHHSPRVLVAVLIAYSALSAVTWPALESLVSSGAGAGELSRRLGVYNCVWSGAGALTMAGAGLLLKHWPAGTFVIPGFWHAAMAVLLWRQLNRSDEAATPSPGTPGEGWGEGPASEIPNLKSQISNPETLTPTLSRSTGRGGELNSASPAPLSPEPELLRARTLALWMSRLALPATFVVISSLLAAMPTLPLIQRLDPATRTVVGSAWMAARWVAFLSLGATVWWHTRPRALLTAALLLLAGFLAVTLRPEWLPGAPGLATAPWLVWMVAWQVVLGLALGLIYAASLYFGMVLSDGSTEHGGYHEALIGLGSILGPGAGAAAQWVRSGDTTLGVVAVSSVLLATTLLASGVSVHLSARR